MNFTQSIDSGFSNYAIFYGRAERGEFWNFMLFVTVVFATGVGIGLLKDAGFAILLTCIFAAGLIIPTASMLVRRLHDVDRSGHWAWFAAVPVIGIAVLGYFCIQPGDTKVNRFGI